MKGKYKRGRCIIWSYLSIILISKKHLIWSGLLSAIDYIWGLSNDLEGEVVSGGDGKSRVDALIPFVHKSHQNGIPLITLHAGNKYLAPMLKAHCVAAENYCLY